MLNSGTETLDEVLGVGNMPRDIKEIRYNYELTNSKNKFVSPIKKIEFIMSDSKSHHRVRHDIQNFNVYVGSSWVCHYYGRQGHIRHYCYKVYGRLFTHYQSHSTWNVKKDARPQQLWKSKGKL